MKTVQYDAYGGPEVLTLRNVERPAPKRGEALIRVHAATVAPGDCKTRAGLLQSFFAVTFPKTPGRYGAGEVVEVGENVDYAQVGDRVVFATDHTENGSCVEYIVRSGEKIAPAPSNATHAEAATVIHEGVSAINCVREAGKVGPAMRVLVHGGAGAVGGACVQFAKSLGAIVTATCREPDRAYVHELGAHCVVAFDREDFSRVVADQDVVIDTQGGDVHRRSYLVLRRGGRLVYLNADPIENRGAEYGVKVVSAGNIAERRAVLESVSRLVERGALKPRLAKILPLAAAAEAHRLVEAGTIKRGRIVLALD